MALGIESLSLQNGADEYPPKADLRELCSQHPLPIIAPGTVDPASLSGDEPTRIALAALKTFNDALAAGDAEKLESCFYPGQAYWKDQLALTYHMRTFKTASVIVAGLLETEKLRGIDKGFEVKGKATFTPATPVLQWIDCELSFKTQSPAGICSGKVLLVPVASHSEDSVSWKIWILSTRLEGLDSHPEDETRLKTPGRSLDDLKSIETDVFIVGAGNAAVSLAARLKTLGVESIMSERNPRVGDNWARRFDSMKFHLPTAFCEMVFMEYPKEQQSPYLLTKDDLAEQVRRYVAAFDLNIINSAEVIETMQFRKPDRRWRIRVKTPAGVCEVVAKHLVQATGIASQKPNLPSLPDEQLYKGISVHSTGFKNGSELIKQGARSVLVVGSANTAFDVLEDCHAAGLQATMVVRSPTYLCPLSYVCNNFSLGAYNFGVEAADKIFLTLPAIVDATLARGLFAQLASQEPDRYSALAAKGFPVLDSQHPEAMLMHNLIERGGGHYVDTGATDLIVEGKVSIKAGLDPVAFTATGLRFVDGSSVDADAIIWCTGFSDHNVRNTSAEILKTNLPVDATWGIDSEGEIRGMWKRHLKVDNYWVMGGYTQQHRYHSRTLALQIKASLEGILPPAYRDTPQPKVAGK